MTGRTHDLAAITALGAIVLVEPLRPITLPTAIVAIFANLVGGIAPDADQPTAPFWRNLPIGKYFGKVFGLLNGGHRFLTHSLIGLGLFVFGFHWLLLALRPVLPTLDIGLVTWAFAIGILSHLVMDSFTKEGVPWLLPIPIKFGFPPIRKFRFTTGKATETLLIFPGLVVLNLYMYSANYPKILQFVHQYLI